MTPKFQPEPVELRQVGTAKMLPPYEPCEACGEEALRDVATKLCRDCWRAVVLGGPRACPECLQPLQAPHAYYCSKGRPMGYPVLERQP